MTGLPLLTILIFIPLVAGLLCLFVRPNGARWIALVATLLDLALGVYLWIAYDPNGAQWQFVEKMPIGGGVRDRCERAWRVRDRTRRSGPRSGPWFPA